MADATGLSLAELIINNGFTDFIDVVYNLGDIAVPAIAPPLVSDNCTAFMVPEAAAPPAMPISVKPGICMSRQRHT